jgi:hypothetical protein
MRNAKMKRPYLIAGIPPVRLKGYSSGLACGADVKKIGIHFKKN